MMKRLLALVLCMVVGWSGIARPAVMKLSPYPYGPGPNECHIPDPGPGGQVSVFVILQFTIGATGVSFSAPVSPYAGLQHVEDVLPPGFTAVGNSQTHVDVSFGGCSVGGAMVMEMRFVRVGDAEPCTIYGLAPGASYFDCALVEQEPTSGYRLALNSNSSFCSSPYRHPFPADDAVDVPLYTVLSWDDPEFPYCIDPLATTSAETSGTGKVYFGTTTNPPYDPLVTYNHGAGPLQPATTYYWRINAELSSRGPLWSFTTIANVATKQSTWGAIKALYR